jgi:hypothetical protein
MELGRGARVGTSLPPLLQPELASAAPRSLPIPHRRLHVAISTAPPICIEERQGCLFASRLASIPKWMVGLGLLLEGVLEMQNYCADPK